MNIKSLMLKSLACALLGSALPAVHAESPLSSDPVAESFYRMLGHQPSRTTPAVPAGIGTDPLRDAISAVLWETQSPSFHQSASYAHLAAQTKPGH